MRTTLSLAFSLLVTSLCVFQVEAATYYVSAGGTNPVSPYADWSTAATNIQDAANLAVSGDTIWVTNGVYQYGGASFNGSNRVYLATGVLLQSMNGPAYTTIQGYWVPGTTNGNNAVRCVYVSPYATISGFTLTNGATQGGEGNGGGVFLQANGTVTNCVIVGNAAENEGGGCWSDQNAIVTGCIISNNIAPSGSGIEGGTVYNSLIVGNGNTNAGSAAVFGTYYNCTIAGNASHGLGAAQGCTLVDCIIYDNTNGEYADCYQCRLTNCCTTVGNGNSLPNNSFSNAPVFLDAAHGNYHLQVGSPGIDGGNNLYVTNSMDLDGNPRIVNGTVDMGCYENQNTNEVLFVSVSSTNAVVPYTNWLTAATNIQDAVGAAQAGNIVVVGAGVYTNAGVVISGNETNVVALTNGITLLGLYGWQSTVIKGGTQTRCVYVGSNSVLSGFTITNGNIRWGGDLTNEQSGGGIWCQPGGLVANCLVISNFATRGPSTFTGGSGGGVYGGTISNCILALNRAASGGGVGGGANVWDCIFTNNIANGGGGASLSVLNGCLLSNNVAAYNGNYGAGGAVSNCVAFNCTMINNINTTCQGGAAYQGTNFYCRIIGNAATYGGGTYQSTNFGCTIESNLVSSYGGGVDGGAHYNCLLAFNVATDSVSFYGLGGGAYLATLYNCTVVSNSATGGGGGIYSSAAYNSIIMFNSVTGMVQNISGSTFPVYHCCVAPTPVAYGAGDFTNDPMFVNPSGGNFHLQSDSPCINAGDNYYVSTTNDLDGNPRIVGYAVDVGAYEKSPASLIPNSWLLKYGLSNDGSDDNADLDGTGFTVYQDWKAGLNPTNSASVLAMSEPTPTNNASGVTVTWQSVLNIVYYVEQSTNLSAQPAFYPIQSNIIGQAGTTSYMDTTATNAGPYFYRVGVQ